MYSDRVWQILSVRITNLPNNLEWSSILVCKLTPWLVDSPVLRRHVDLIAYAKISFTPVPIRLLALVTLGAGRVLLGLSLNLL